MDYKHIVEEEKLDSILSCSNYTYREECNIDQEVRSLTSPGLNRVSESKTHTDETPIRPTEKKKIKTMEKPCHIRSNTQLTIKKFLQGF